MQGSVSAIRHGHQVVGAEGLAATVSVELVAAGAKHLAAGGIRTGSDFQKCEGAVSVVLDRKALEMRVAVWARGGSKSLFHGFIIA